MAAAILGGVDAIWIVSNSCAYSFGVLYDACDILFVSMFKAMFLYKYVFCVCFLMIKKPGARVLYLGAASGTTVSHVSDIVGPVSCFYWL